jgi:hypothetical protein
MRAKKHGENVVTIYDFTDKDGPAWFEMHSEERYDLYKKEGFEVIGKSLSVV